MVDVTWFGHCCFEVKGEKYTVLTDPHDGISLGLPIPKSEPDVVLISHPHEDHASGKKYYKYVVYHFTNIGKVCTNEEHKSCNP